MDNQHPQQAPGDPIDRFLSRVRRRMDLRVALAAAAWSVAAAATAYLLVGFFYVTQGYSVDSRWGLASIAAALLATGGAWVARRATRESAARLADRQFGLKDALVSTLHFRAAGRRGGFYELQRSQTAAAVTGLNTTTIGCRPPRKPTAAAAFLVVLAIALALVGPSAAIRQLMALQRQTLARSEAANAELEQLVREISDDPANAIDDDLIDEDKLRELVEALRATKDQKEALRQYARLEQQVQKQLTKLTQKLDEALLASVAEELAQEAALKSLATRLQAKRYTEAAGELQQMLQKMMAAREEDPDVGPEAKEAEQAAEAPKKESGPQAERAEQAEQEDQPTEQGRSQQDAGEQGRSEQDEREQPEQGPPEPGGDQQAVERLSERQEQLARLRSASKRMAAAVRKRRSVSQRKVGVDRPQRDGATPRAPADDPLDSDAQGSELSDLGEQIENLDQEVSEMQQAMKQAAMQERLAGSVSPEQLAAMQRQQAKADSAMSKLAQTLRSMQAKRAAAAQLRRLSAAAASAQSGIAQAPGPPGPPKVSNEQPQGGDPGRGVGTTGGPRQEERQEALADNDNFQRLRGAMGEGPTLTTVEDADEGTAISGRRGAARRREFQKQFESFVAREDVPEEVREGVKQYFEAIHSPQKNAETGPE